MRVNKRVCEWKRGKELRDNEKEERGNESLQDIECKRERGGEMGRKERKTICRIKEIIMIKFVFHISII